MPGYATDARANLSRLKFLSSNPELRKALANPSQRQIRAAAKGATK